MIDQFAHLFSRSPSATHPISDGGPFRNGFVFTQLTVLMIAIGFRASDTFFTESDICDPVVFGIFREPRLRTCSRSINTPVHAARGRAHQHIVRAFPYHHFQMYSVWRWRRSRTRFLNNIILRVFVHVSNLQCEMSTLRAHVLIVWVSKIVWFPCM